MAWWEEDQAQHSHCNYFWRRRGQVGAPMYGGPLFMHKGPHIRGHTYSYTVCRGCELWPKYIHMIFDSYIYAPPTRNCIFIEISTICRAICHLLKQQNNKKNEFEDLGPFPYQKTPPKKTKNEFEDLGPPFPPPQSMSPKTFFLFFSFFGGFFVFLFVSFFRFCPPTPKHVSQNLFCLCFWLFFGFWSPRP